MKRWLSALLLVVSAGTAVAQHQVGYAPSRSPYRDLQQSMELSLLYGYYSAAPDPAGVAPQSGDMITLLYGWHATKMLFLNAELSHVETIRNVLDPYAANRNAGTAYWPLWEADGMISLSATGDRTYHGLIPLINAGMGFVTDRHSHSDVGDYQFGTRFELLWGATLRYAVNSRWGIRVDFTNRLYSMNYPQSYYTPSSTDSMTIVPTTLSRTFWRNNPSISIGVSYLFSH